MPNVDYQTTYPEVTRLVQNIEELVARIFKMYEQNRPEGTHYNEPENQHALHTLADGCTNAIIVLCGEYDSESSIEITRLFLKALRGKIRTEGNSQDIESILSSVAAAMLGRLKIVAPPTKNAKSLPALPEALTAAYGSSAMEVVKPDQAGRDK